ncbi:Prefoldin [Lineolata rhizophorae]|uniref:Prefoldin n=1 Tax=Lineolata rhizophorae TaxID=578093 RepID=A0A6A6PAL3_9PEZI|nr:Prefoldin [Lineolata rhizophorae]
MASTSAGAAGAGGGGGGGQTVELSSLGAPQLTQLKKQLDDELQHLSSSFQSLRGAQAKFRDCGRSVADGVAARAPGQPVLVPLTPSLYVPGRLAGTESVLVDVGTGFFVEKGTKDAREFYGRKVEELGRNLGELEKIVQQKAGNLRVIEDALRQKLMTGGDGPSSPPASGS